jgi:hypothetical protein
VSWHPLGLTSPLTRGNGVTTAQLLLQKHGWLHGAPVDGEYGPLTAAATRRAKYALGYPRKEVNGTFGPVLYAYLTGAKRVPARYKARAAIRRARARAAADRSKVRRAALDRACAEARAGVKEHPANSNRATPSLWYGLIGPWCMMGVTWAYVTAGYKGKAFLRGVRWASVPAFWNDAVAGRNGVHVIHPSDVQPGDPVCFDWDGGVPDHVGMFRYWINRTLGTFATVEANTAFGNDSNGGAWMERERDLSQVEGFVRVE